LRPEDVELLVRGALRHGVELAAWLARAEAAGVKAGDFLLRALEAEQDEVRRRAAQMLGSQQALRALAWLLRRGDAAVRARAAATLGELDHPRAFRALQRARHDRQPEVRNAAWAGLEARNHRSAAWLRRRDETTPLLVAGSLVYWLLLVLNWGVASTWPAWALAGGVWLAAWLVLGRLVPRLSPRLLAWPSTVVIAGLLIARWRGWGGTAALLALILLGGDLRSRPHLALAALLPHLPLLGLLPASARNVLWATGGTLLALALLALAGGRWGRYRTDRPQALALLAAALGAAAGAALAGAGGSGLVATLLMAAAVIAVRWWTRRPPAYSGSQNDLLQTADLVRTLWDLPDSGSHKFKLFLGSVVGATWCALLLRAAAGLTLGGAPVWSIPDALLLGAGLGVGLWWVEKGLWQALVLPALGGALGGALARGVQGAIVGTCLGLGLGFGEWLAARMEAAREEGAPGTASRLAG
jgi:hypothetical protein